ncbi:hypothetical protein STTU_5276 [Streptomyces sp. Tu6071]|nr:hypothetical protein STTU_5276 [Streptomyces sp. Tu6071]
MAVVGQGARGEEVPAEVERPTGPRAQPRWMRLALTACGLALLLSTALWAGGDNLLIFWLPCCGVLAAGMAVVVLFRLRRAVRTTGLGPLAFLRTRRRLMCGYPPRDSAGHRVAWFVLQEDQRRPVREQWPRGRWRWGLPAFYVVLGLVWALGGNWFLALVWWANSAATGLSIWARRGVEEWLDWLTREVHEADTGPAGVRPPAPRR